ncbi:putative transcription factor bHLH family [Helianthus annuus]|uniref:Putative myc-type, basic helix-loop-helix (BHLH) domain-containing protein n=1 Tax=Helianthus annuus TaxID=4232 RepID=A0A251SIQ3_HELAN|nr:transcription factor bHLH18 [Helianthus annuus]KAF5769595.1 putative transcription factor bHLH family [Helianthus annuus]KAJ0469182.1 putative transcription factor bHLH family [Helianthus annuus]KAJ0840836.1 putative transcription factor bHLH family [Helianthus annuus]KAJ0854264.1 putative transcription factor bHLH family [Helianthus annuus]
MDIQNGAWFPELDMEYPHELMNQPGIYSYSELAEVFSSQGYKGYENLTTRNQHIGATTTNLVMQESNMATSTSSFAPIFGSSLNTFNISFGDITSPATINQKEISGGYKLDYHNALKATEKMNLNELHGSIELPKRVSSTTRRNRRQAQDHILAERKRREKLNQLFMSLYARLPEIKKMDKATVLEDAIKYIKHLQNRVKELEETSITGNNIIHESTASMKTSKFHGGDELDHASSFDETISLPCNRSYNPGIKVRISGNSILVRIYCQRNSLLALKVLAEMEGLHFTVMYNNALPISGNDALITIIAEMSEQFVITSMDLVKCLGSALSNFL